MSRPKPKWWTTNHAANVATKENPHFAVGGLKMSDPWKNEAKNSVLSYKKIKSACTIFFE